MIKPRRTLGGVVVELHSSLGLPASMEKMGFRSASPKSAMERDLDSGTFIRDPVGGIPTLIVSYARVDKGYLLRIFSSPSEDRYSYISPGAVERELVSEIVNDYLTTFTHADLIEDTTVQ